MSEMKNRFTNADMANGFDTPSDNMIGDLANMPVPDLTANENFEEDEEIERVDSEVVSPGSFFPQPSEEMPTEPLENIEPIEDMIIKELTPLTLTTYSSDANQKIVSSMIFLCKTIDDKLITICKNYIMRDEDEIDYMKSMPFHDEQNFISKQISAAMIVKSLPSFISEFEPCLDENEEKDKIFHVVARPNKPNDPRRINIFMSPDLFTSMAFTENYIMDGIINEHDIMLATAMGVNKKDDSIVPFKVDRVELMTLCRENKRSTNVGALFKVYKYSGSGNESFKILNMFDLGNKKKFNKNPESLENIRKGFLQDSDQYITNLMFNCRLDNLDKDYTFLRCENKDGVGKLIMLDNDIMNDLSDMVSQY